MCYYYICSLSDSAPHVLSQHEWTNTAPAPWVQAAAFVHGCSVAQDFPRDAALGGWLMGCALPHWHRCPAGTHGCNPLFQVVFALMSFASGRGLEVYKGGHISHGWAHPFPGCNICQSKSPSVQINKIQIMIHKASNTAAETLNLWQLFLSIFTSSGLFSVVTHKQGSWWFSYSSE